MKAVAYRERASAVPGVVLWQRDPCPLPATGRILPDGCMDLIWDGIRLFVAGPDTTARWHTSEPNACYVGLRFSRGLGPGLLGTAADEVRDQSPPLDDLWPCAEARVLSDQVAADAEQALERWLKDRTAHCEPPQLGAAVFHLAGRGTPVTAMADRLGYSTRQLHRRCLPLFGYGPQHLSRVLRLRRALAAAREGMPLAQAAATAGFADQAHLSREARDLTGTTPTGLLSELAG
jgi:AraC-like DNA-binding protein